ncbi:MAG: S9 family peptidase [Opitutus sp.]|nr:S9 family peptidase [Opitutus sp.]
MTRFLLPSLGLVLPLLAAEPRSAPGTPVPELPVATFFQSPLIASLTFSPNGKYIACLVPFERRMNLAVIDLEKGTKHLLTNFKDRQATQPSWASNDRILFRVDDEGQESFALYAVSRDGKDPTILASGFSKAGTTGEANVRFRSVLGRIEGDDKNVLVLANITYRDWSDVATMNLKTGKMTKVIEAPGNVAYYVRDHAGDVRLAVVEERSIRRVLARDPKTKEWSTLTEHRRGQPGWEPIAFDGDNRTLYVSTSVGRRTVAVARFDLGERTTPEIVFADDTYDVLAANAAATGAPVPTTVYDPTKKKIVGLSYSADRTRHVWFDPEMKALQEKLEASLPDTVHAPRQFTADGSKIIYFSHSDRDPGVFYLYDRARQKLSELAVVKPAIEPEKMAAMKRVVFTARDGLRVHGYLTLPKNRPAKNLPLILHPHGGPFGIRDEWGYRDEVQFYANRGYAVLQIDYRGSGGYGGWFQAAGYRKWGLEMQDDLTDGVKWAIAEGIADAGRVVISGASYGGYATMAGLAFTPELYCAGVNYVGVTNLTSHWGKFQGTADQLNLVHEWFANLDKAEDRKRVHDTSPSNFADRIRAPVFMAYGRNDPRVHIDQGYDMERALKKAGKTHEMMIEADEGHGFRMEEKRIAFYSRVDEFLKKYVQKAYVKIGPTEVIEMPAKPK